MREGLTACLAVPRWVDEVVAAGPYSSLDQLVDPGPDVRRRRWRRPRSTRRWPIIRGSASGRRASGQAQSFSHAEQASSASDDEQLAAALAEGNRAYEEKFGRIFLIRAAGRSRPEILAELRRRLELDPAEELQQVGAELRDIALLRIPQLFSHLDSHSGYDESEAAR